MKKIVTDKLTLSLETEALETLTFATEDAAQNILSKIWHEEIDYLTHFIAIFYKKNIKKINERSSFITMSHLGRGYIQYPNEPINTSEAKKQIEIDLEIINRESQWSREESIYFQDWWPKPVYDSQKNILEFGVSLQDIHKKVINRTLNRILLTRYGYLELNYSLSEKDLNSDKTLNDYQKDMDEIFNTIHIAKGNRYKDINPIEDFPSKSKILNLILSAEIF